MQYVLAINIGRTFADRISSEAVQTAVRQDLVARGYGMPFAPQCRVTVPEASRFDVFSVGVPRAVVVVSLAVTRVSLTPTDVRAIDTAILTAVFRSVGAPTESRDWNVSLILANLPANGSGNSGLALVGRNGEPTDISRDIASGDSVPVPSAINPTMGSEVLQTTEPNVPVGTKIPSGAEQGIVQGANAIDRFIASHSAPIIAATVVLGLGATAVIVVNVRKVLA